MARLRIIDGSKPAPKPRTVVVCACETRSRTFVQAVTGLVRDDKGILYTLDELRKLDAGAFAKAGL